MRRQALQDAGHGPRIVSGPLEVGHAELVGLQFLTARIAQGGELRRGAGDLLAELAESAVAEHRAGEHLPEHAKQRVLLRFRLALGRMPRRDVADLMPHDRGQFGLVVHQVDKLAGDVDIAAGNGEGIVDRAVEQRDGKRRLGVCQARLDGNVLADLLDVLRLRAGFRTAVLGEELGVVFGPLRCLLLGDRRTGGNAAAGHRGARRQCQRGGSRKGYRPNRAANFFGHERLLTLRARGLGGEPQRIVAQ